MDWWWRLWCFRQSPGLLPVSRRKKRQKYAGSVIPTRAATCRTGRSVWASRRWARYTRVSISSRPGLRPVAARTARVRWPAVTPSRSAHSRTDQAAVSGRAVSRVNASASADASPGTAAVPEAGACAGAGVLPGTGSSPGTGALRGSGTGPGPVPVAVSRAVRTTRTCSRARSTVSYPAVRCRCSAASSAIRRPVRRSSSALRPSPRAPASRRSSRRSSGWSTRKSSVNSASVPSSPRWSSQQWICPGRITTSCAGRTGHRSRSTTWVAEPAVMWTIS